MVHFFHGGEPFGGVVAPTIQAPTPGSPVPRMQPDAHHVAPVVRDAIRRVVIRFDRQIPAGEAIPLARAEMARHAVVPLVLLRHSSPSTTTSSPQET